MGRYVSIPIESQVYYGIRDIKPGYGTGGFRFFGVSGTFLVPSGVDEVRVTVLGAGGCGSSFTNSSNQSVTGHGGGGGGYVVATVPVTAGCTCNIGVGAGNGGSSCFGTAVYAYGGCNATNAFCNCCFAGGTFCVCSGTQIAGYCGNKGCPGSCGTGTRGVSFGTGPGGASGSPAGGNCLGPFPGISGSDIFNCKGFNGEDVPESDLASKFGNTLRWPGEVLLGTSRAATTIVGTAAGNPPVAYCVTAFGGGSNHCYCCGTATCPYANAGYGGGQAGDMRSCYCYNDFGYGTCQCWQGAGCFLALRGCSGTGFVVVEY